MKSKKSIFNSRGFTLIEITVTLAILAIVLTVAGSVYFYGNRIYTQTVEKNSAKYVGDTVYEYMQSRLVKASAINVGGSESTSSLSQEFKIDNSHLYSGARNSTRDTFGSDWYNTYTISYEISDVSVNSTSSPYQLTLTVIVKNSSGEEVYRTGYNSNTEKKGTAIKVISIENNSRQTTGMNYNQGITFANTGVSTDPVITYDTDTTAAVSDETALINQMEDAIIKVHTSFANSPQDTSALPDKWDTYVSSATSETDQKTKSDLYRTYVYQYYYANTTGKTFPILTFSPDVISATDANCSSKLSAYLGSAGRIYMQPYMYSGDCSVYLCATTTSDNTAYGQTRLIYDKEEEKWYFYVNDAINVPEKAWSDVKTTIHGSGWIKVSE